MYAHTSLLRRGLPSTSCYSCRNEERWKCPWGYSTRTRHCRNLFPRAQTLWTRFAAKLVPNASQVTISANWFAWCLECIALRSLGALKSLCSGKLSMQGWGTSSLFTSLKCSWSLISPRLRNWDAVLKTKPRMLSRAGKRILISLSNSAGWCCWVRAWFGPQKQRKIHDSL